MKFETMMSLLKNQGENGSGGDDVSESRGRNQSLWVPGGVWSQG